jgi:hypothetical protein
MNSKKNQKNQIEPRKIRYFYTDEQMVYYIDHDDKSNELKSHSVIQKGKEMEKYNYFECQKNFLKNHQELIRYKNEFNTCVNNIEKEFEKKNIKFKYRTKYNHNSAVLLLWKYLENANLELCEFDKIEDYEFLYLERTNNGALTYMNKNFEDTITECFGTDYNSYYPNLLMNNLKDDNYKLKMPVKKGHLESITELDFDNLKYGIYKCDIRYKNIFKEYKFNDENKGKKQEKTFKLNNYGYYTHYDLIYCSKYPNEYEITLYKEPNNLLYWKSNELIETNLIFYTWYNTLSKIKLELGSDNFVLKKLMSSLWGSMCQFKKVFFNEEQIENLSISKLSSQKETEYKILNIKTYPADNKLGYKEVFECVKSKEAYKNEYARLKPFLMSVSRLNMINIIKTNKLENNLIRIHTDNITLNIDFDYSKHYNYYPKKEDKTTGNIKWYNVNKYKHICSKCKNEFEYKIFKDHKC